MLPVLPAHRNAINLQTHHNLTHTLQLELSHTSVDHARSVAIPYKSGTGTLERHSSCQAQGSEAQRPPSGKKSVSGVCVTSPPRSSANFQGTTSARGNDPNGRDKAPRTIAVPLPQTAALGYLCHRQRRLAISATDSGAWLFRCSCSFRQHDRPFQGIVGCLPVVWAPDLLRCAGGDGGWQGAQRHPNQGME